MKRLVVGVLLASSAWPQAAAPAVPSYKALKFADLPAVKLPQVVQAELPNGIRLMLLEDHELPLVNGFAMVRTGNLFDPEDRVGLADLTGAVMRSGGTRAATGDELDERLENMAASVESGIGETTGQVSFSCLKENLDGVLAIFRDVLTEPEFRLEKLDLARIQMRSGILRRNDEAAAIAGREFASIVYGRGTPYGWRSEIPMLERVTREDLRGFYRRYFFPKNTILAVYGDFNAAEMQARLTKQLGGWSAAQPAAPAFPGVRMQPSPGVYVATKNDVSQSFFQLGHFGGKLNDPDLAALEVMADILGSGFSSRLVRKVRTQMGLAYDVSASWGAQYEHPGLFRIAGSTRGEATTETLKVILEEVDRLRATEVTEQELTTAKQILLNSFVFNFERPAMTLARLVRYEYFGYPKDFIFQYQKAIASVTRADVLRVAKAYLKPADFTIVVAGKPEVFKQPLSSLGRPVREIDLAIPGAARPEPTPPAKPAETEQAASAPKPAVVKQAESTPEPASGVEELRRIQTALGGVEQLAAVRDLKRVAEVFLMAGPNGAMRAKQTSYWIAPNVYRQENEMPVGRIASFYDGQGGWVVSPQGSMALTGPVLDQMRGQLFHDFLTLILSDRVTGRTVARGADGVLLIKEGANSVSLYYDPATGLPLKIAYGAAGAGMVEEVYDDYRAAGNIRLPGRMSISQDGRKFADANILDIQVNSGLKLEELSKQP